MCVSMSYESANCGGTFVNSISATLSIPLVPQRAVAEQNLQYKIIIKKNFPSQNNNPQIVYRPEYYQLVRKI